MAKGFNTSNISLKNSLTSVCNLALVTIQHRPNLENLILSFKFYDQLCHQAINYIRTNSCEEVLINSNNVFKCYRNNLVEKFIRDIDSVFEVFKAKPELDLSQLISFYDCLDIQFSRGFLSPEHGAASLDTMREIASQNDCGYVTLLHECQIKMKNLSGLIAMGLYQEQYFIDPYAYASNLDSLQERNDRLSNRTKMFVISKDSDEESLSKYLDADEKYESIFQSANFYTTWMLKTIETLYDPNDGNIQEFINSYFNCLLTLKLSAKQFAAEHLKKNNQVDLHLGYESFFTPLETLQYFIMREGDALIIPEYQSVDLKFISQHVNSIKEIYGDALEEPSRQLHFHITQMQNLIIEYICFVARVKYGIYVDTSEFSVANTLEALSMKDLQAIE